MKKAVFLDRDGVINKAIVKNGLPTSPSLLDELKILPGVKESILKLKKLNFVCIIVTNQPDVSRGKINKNTVIKINNFLKKKIKLDDIFVCYHDDKDNCNCRKPKTGLLEQAISDFKINIKQSWFIGDSKSDMIAATSIGLNPVLLERNGDLLKAVNLIEHGEKKCKL